NEELVAVDIVVKRLADHLTLRGSKKVLHDERTKAVVVGENDPNAARDGVGFVVNTLDVAVIGAALRGERVRGGGVMDAVHGVAGDVIDRQGQGHGTNRPGTTRQQGERPA